MDQFHSCFRWLFIRGLFALAAAAAAVFVAMPAHAQLAAGCTCPAGTASRGVNSCLNFHTEVLSPATCTTTPGAMTPGAGATGQPPNPAALSQSIGHIAASMQQMSFTGVQAILQERRDQLQGTLGVRKSTSTISGYSESEFDDFGVLGYAGEARTQNPLVPLVVKSAPAPQSSGPTWATWVQGLGDWERESLPPTPTFFTTMYSGQTGFDGTWRDVAKTGDAFVLGLVGSWTGSHTSYDGMATTTRLQGPGVGTYGQYVVGAFSADLTPKVDFFNLTENFGTGLAPASLNLINAGLSGNAQYKVDLKDSNYIEPTGGFSFTRTLFDSNAAALGLTDASTLRLQAGARFGTTLTIAGISIEPSVKALVYSDVIATNSASATILAAGIVPTDQGLLRGEVDPALSLDFGNGYSGALSGLVRFGTGVIGGSANINVRKQW
jgi:Autotransporter beta-domain